ncbi:hypothetical protein JW758_06040 [Candidatus Peregrinibacteria bacterium]|nr:hypothetical protein [Candidatus Peregrinibacteria bacterium]
MHRMEKHEGEPNQTYSDVAFELAELAKRGLDGTDESDGMSELKRAFRKSESNQDNPSKIISILKFLSEFIDEDDDRLSKVLSSLSGDDANIQAVGGVKEESSKVLGKLLKGELDEHIKSAKIARMGQVYSLALYLYMHTTSDSKIEIANVLEGLINHYDDPRANSPEQGYYGMKSTNYFLSLSSKAMEMHRLENELRGRFRDVLSDTKTEDDGNPAHLNAHLVIPKAKKRSEPPRVHQSVSDSVAPPMQ